MVKKMQKRTNSEDLSEFMQYLAAQCRDEANQLPTLSKLSASLGISVATLREQLEVARALGLVEVRPRTGIKLVPYSFRPAVKKSLDYALAVHYKYFRNFSDLRNHLEMSYFQQAAVRLLDEDYQKLRTLVNQAQAKLMGDPIQIPHFEHRELHLTIYRRLDNPFVLGLLESYWDVYEAVGLDVYTDITYLERVWNYHQQIVEAICAGDITSGYQALIEHMELLVQRSKPVSNQKIE
jgi:DNA-binding FadR family transcriptional regulator